MTSRMAAERQHYPQDSSSTCAFILLNRLIDVHLSYDRAYHRARTSVSHQTDRRKQRMQDVSLAVYQVSLTLARKGSM